MVRGTPLKIIVSLVVVGVLVGNVWSTCPDNWIAFRQSCYLFETQPEEFIVAEHFCRQHNSHLLHVDNDMENRFVRDWLKKLKPSSWWFGLTDNIIEDIWMWADTDSAPEFTDWYPNRPDDKDGSQDCAIYNQYIDFKWDDTTCSSRDYFICEKPKQGGALELIG